VAEPALAHRRSRRCGPRQASTRARRTSLPRSPAAASAREVGGGRGPGAGRRPFRSGLLEAVTRGLDALGLVSLAAEGRCRTTKHRSRARSSRVVAGGPARGTNPSWTAAGRGSGDALVEEDRVPVRRSIRPAGWRRPRPGRGRRPAAIAERRRRKGLRDGGHQDLGAMEVGRPDGRRRHAGDRDGASGKLEDVGIESPGAGQSADRHVLGCDTSGAGDLGIRDLTATRRRPLHDRGYSDDGAAVGGSGRRRSCCVTVVELGLRCASNWTARIAI
jgi:hypothetical protein